MFKSTKSKKELVWENLKKEYLTTEQKLDIIREYNKQTNEAEFQELIKELKEYLAKRK